MDNKDNNMELLIINNLCKCLIIIIKTTKTKWIQISNIRLIINNNTQWGIHKCKDIIILKWGKFKGKLCMDNNINIKHKCQRSKK